VEEHGVNFLGVAGTSAGSIVAALIAAGWRSDELYDPSKPVGQKGRFEVDFPSGGNPEMNHDTRDAQSRRSLMESAGFRLQNEDELGIYVREERERDMID
jgi:hypothetical protein